MTQLFKNPLFTQTIHQCVFILADKKILQGAETSRLGVQTSLIRTYRESPRANLSERWIQGYEMQRKACDNLVLDALFNHGSELSSLAQKQAVIRVQSRDCK